MLMLNAIPHLKVYKQKAILTRDTKKQMNGSVILLNTNNHENAVKFLDHPMITTNAKFLTYFIDPIYKDKYGTKQIRLNYKSERKELYKNLRDTHSNIRTPVVFSAIGTRNVYYDISMLNTLFFTYTRTSSIKKRINDYITKLLNIINDSKLSEYSYKTVVINVDGWDSSNIHNPISYLYIALKRYPEIFSKLGDIEIVFYTDKMLLRCNPSLCDIKKDATVLKREISKLSKSVIYADDDELDKIIQHDEAKSKVVATITKTQSTEPTKTDTKKEDEEPVVDIKLDDITKEQEK